MQIGKMKSKYVKESSESRKKLSNPETMLSVANIRKQLKNASASSFSKPGGNKEKIEAWK